MYCSTLVSTWKPFRYRALVELVLVAPAIAAEPLRFRGLDEVHPKDELVLVDRPALRDLVIAHRVSSRAGLAPDRTRGTSSRSGSIRFAGMMLPGNGVAVIVPSAS